ncbi:MAG: UDP-GlcNAc--UDP-phosphate GlcNAc-1-phosphate transferase [Bacteroidota bacterium]
MLYVLYLGISLLLFLSYFKLAERFDIVDRPNHRSSHKQMTILGAGIVFPVIMILHSILNNFAFPLFIVGLTLISVISFYDDLKPLSYKLRLGGHFISVLLLCLDSGLMSTHVWILVLSFIIIIGTINAYNFMDGINGLTGAYSLVIVCSLYLINTYEVEFISSLWLIACGISLLVFNLFNFRLKAKCFAGDAGSISMAYILIFFTALLIVKTEDLKYIGLLLLYGLDSVTTIIFRLIRRENIFEAHRSHFYQYLANIKSWPHLVVSSLYALLQFIINIYLIFNDFTGFSFFVFLLVAGVITLIMRFFVEGRQNLLGLRA